MFLFKPTKTEREIAMENYFNYKNYNVNFKTPSSVSRTN